MTATLIREDGDGRCAKCAEASGKHAHIATATYTLTKADGRQWRLCLGCACRAAHALGIVHRTFNPTGAQTVAAP